jgi:1,4-alpha-glucan branching enzyme
VQRFVRDLNRLYRETPALHEMDFRPEGFEWIDFRDVDNSVVSLLRRGKDPSECAVCVFNFTPCPGRDTASASRTPAGTSRP